MDKKEQSQLAEESERRMFSEMPTASSNNWYKTAKRDIPGLLHIYENGKINIINNITQEVNETTYETFVKNDMLIDAVIRNIETHQYNTK